MKSQGLQFTNYTNKFDVISKNSYGVLRGICHLCNLCHKWHRLKNDYILTVDYRNRTCPRKINLTYYPCIFIK